METRYQGAVAFVTGGGSGIGAAAVRRFAAEGACVVVVDRRIDAAREVAGLLGDRALAVEADVRREADLEQAVRAAVTRFGRLDVAVNAAGYGASAEIVDMTLEQWQGVLDVDLTGVFLATKHEARQMLRQRSGGAIVNIASANAVQPGEGLSGYCVAKAGVVMFTQVAGMELAPHGIRVNAVGPGLTRTPLTQPFLESKARARPWIDGIPAGRAAQPEEVAALIAWIGSPEAEYMSGETVYMDGGMRARAYPTLVQRRGGAYAGPEFLRTLKGPPQ